MVSMSSQTLPQFTPEEYLEYDRTHEGKHEYVEGAIVAMAGGTTRHALATMNIGALLHAGLTGGPCRVYSSDLRVCIDSHKLYAYPDVTVVCGPEQHVDKREDTITNPKLLVEVLSPSTRQYDLNYKMRLYWRIPSVSELIFVECERVSVEHWRRIDGDQWSRELIEDRAATLHLPTLDIEIPVAQIYDGIELQ